MLNQRPLFRFFLLLFFLSAVGKAAFATTAVVPRDDDMVIESRAIITGKVIGLSTAADSDTQLVYTYVRVSVNTVLKGQITEREIVLKELGGETRDHGTLIYGMPRFEPGQEVFLYLNTWRDGSLRVHQGFLGKFDISRDAATGRSFVERRMEDQNILITADSANGTNRSELDKYTAMVTGLIEANGKRMLHFESQYYQSIPVLTHPPEFEPSAGFTLEWALLNPATPSRWFEADNHQPIVFYVNPAGAPSFAVLQDDMQAVMNAWSKSGALITVNYGGTSNGCGVMTTDGLNSISFNNCDGYFAPSQSCAGLVATSGIISYIPSQTRTVGGITYGKALEANMSFNPYALCNFTNRCQFQEVATHEMGHALGLGHASDVTATMWPYAHFDNRCASLMQDDVRGIVAVYPNGTSAGQVAIVTSSLPDANQYADYSATLEANGGTAYHWSLVNGQVPSGIQLGLSGLIYGRTKASGSFTFTTQVVGSSGNAAQRSFTLVVNPSPWAPVIQNAELRRKKLYLTGQKFQANALVYVDGEVLGAGLNGTMLVTQKRRQKPGVHQVYVVNPDGLQSNTFQFVAQ